ncbi:unnamed protein product [Caenorhabditis sp. 36 PRJEB53466]|nr:unnamed protein product [Caenorhabditis sp. 36 PRJEB53466]
MPAAFKCPILVDFLSLKDSRSFPTMFLYDCDVLTTLASLRSLICQWTDIRSTKSLYFKRNPHYCQLDESGRMYLNTATNFTVPFEKSTACLNRFTLLEHGQTWEEFISTSYSGVAKFRLKNGICVAFTYKVYAQSRDQPIDIIVRTEQAVQTEVEFHFINCFFTKKKLWRYSMYRNRTFLEEELNSDDLWNKLSPEKQTKLLDALENRLPEFLVRIGNGIECVDQVNIVSPVENESVWVTPRNNFEPLY